MSDDQPLLFEGFGKPREKRVTKKPDRAQVKLRWPWVLLGTHKSPPRAHILDEKRAQNVSGGKGGHRNTYFAVCGLATYKITPPEGEPVAVACVDCRRITGRTSDDV